MRRAAAASRHMVWLAALAGVLLLPLAAAVVPAWRALPRPAELITPAVQAARAPAVEAEAPTVEAAAAAPGSFIKSNGVVVPLRDVTAAGPIAPPAVEALEDARTPLPWKAIALAVWMAGAAILLIRLGMGVLAVWRMERGAAELDDERWTALTDRLSRRMGLRRIVRLLRGPTSAVPMTASPARTAWPAWSARGTRMRSAGTSA